MPKGKRKKGRKSERLIYKLTARFRDPGLFAGQNLAVVASRAIRDYMATGEHTPGVQLIGWWRNPDNKNPLHSNWKRSADEGQSLEGFRKTILERVGAKASQFRFESPSAAAVKNATEVAREKRSAAAKKGAQRRKYTAQVKAEGIAERKRSAAAKKGWKTRKAKTK
jgi:hypothetical protein